MFQLNRGLMQSRAALDAAPAGGGAPTYEFTAQLADQVDRTVYTFTATNIGTAATGRVVVVGVMSYAGAIQPLSLKINNVAATEVPNSRMTQNGIGTGCWYGVVDTGATADIEVTYASNCDCCGIRVYALKNVSATHASEAHQANGSTGRTNSVTQAADSICLSWTFSQNRTDAGTYDSPLIEDGTMMQVGGSFAPCQSAHSVTAGSHTLTWNGGGSDASVMFSVVFNKA